MLFDTRFPLSLSLSSCHFGEVCACEIQKNPEKNHLISIYDIKCGRITFYMDIYALRRISMVVSRVCVCAVAILSGTRKFQSSNLLWFIILTVHRSKPFYFSFLHFLCLCVENCAWC